MAVAEVPAEAVAGVPAADVVVVVEVVDVMTIAD